MRRIRGKGDENEGVGRESGRERRERRVKRVRGRKETETKEGG